MLSVKPNLKVEFEEISTTPRYSNDFLRNEDFFQLFEAKCKDNKSQFNEKLFDRFLKHHRKKECQKILNMDNSSFGVNCALVIAQILQRHNNFRIVNLSGNSIGYEGSLAIAGVLVRSPYIISLDVSSNNLSDECISLFFTALCHNNSVVHLNASSVGGVNRNSLGLKSMKALGDMLIKNKTLSELHLSMTEISYDSMKPLSTGIMNNNTLRVLNLSNNNLRSKGTISLLTSMKDSALVTLNLSNNHIKDDVAPHFAELFSQNTLLENLDISGNEIGFRFINSIAMSLSNNNSLKDLDLSRNSIGGRCMGTLGSALAVNKSLRKLNISACNIDEAGFAEFCSHFSANQTLNVLLAQHNPIQDVGCIALTSILKSHPTLKEIDLEFCEISDSSSVPFFTSIMQSPSLEKISLKNNLIKNGEIIQKATNDNNKILSLNIELNDIEYKVLSEIQRQLSQNTKEFKESREKQISLDVTFLPQFEAELRDTRREIDERKHLVEVLTKSLENAVVQLGQSKISRERSAISLEKRYEELNNQESKLSEDYQNQFDELGNLLRIEETEISYLLSKSERERDQFKIESKALSGLESRLKTQQQKSSTDLASLSLKRSEIISRYKQNQERFTDAFYKAKGIAPDDKKEKKKPKPVLSNK